MRASILIAALVELILVPPAAVAQQAASSAGQLRPVVLDSTILAGYRWRNIGPDRGGRSIAVSGVRGRPNEAYFGAVGGGLWKTVDGGQNWFPVTDGQIRSASVGAVAVSETNPDIVFIGMGESCIRGNIMPGDGVYKSTDGGKTWAHVGFSESQAISKIRIHPTNPDIVYVASFGKYSVPSPERGIYKSTDGGRTWRRVLYRDDKTGGVDIAIDRRNPNVIYAALWEAYRKEYQMSSGGPGSGLFKSTDGGETWTEITRNPGLPRGLVGKIGLSVSGANPNRVYALIENEPDGGLYRSEDGGATWTLINNSRSIRQRAFYYTHVFADPNQADVVYIQNTSIYRSTDGGKTLTSVNNGTHGDFHDLWIDPDDSGHLVVGNDGGGAVSKDTAQSWTEQNFPTGQFYHVITTKHIPFHVCGAQQDNTTICTPFNYNAAAFGFGIGGGQQGGQAGRSRDITAGSMRLSYPVGGGEPGYIAPDPLDFDIFYSGANNGRYVDKYNRRLGTSREVSPYPWFYSGEPAKEIRERWQWTFPIIFSPVDPKTLYVSSQRLWVTRDGGQTWTALSGDLTRHDPQTLERSGGPITGDMNGPEVYATIFSVGPGKINLNTIWVGSDDGLVHVTRDGGRTWVNVTPPGMPEFGRVSQVDASAFDDGTAYIAVKRPLLNDLSPYIFKTNDYGRTWTKIVNGIRPDAYVHAVREDPYRRGMLYAATQHGVYVSYDDGASWQPLNRGLPDIPVVDLVVEKNELVIASHGRGFWVLDNIAPLRQASPERLAADAWLFTPPEAIRSGPGVTFSWWLKAKPQQVLLELVDSTGAVLRTWEPDTSAPRPAAGGAQDPAARFRPQRIPAKAGLNYVHWDLRTQPWVAFPGMILWGVQATAPAAPPGRYTLRLTVDGRTLTAPVVVKRNPWITDVTDADLHAQYAFARKIRDRVNDANSAVIEIRRVKAQLDDRLQRSNDSRLRAAAERLRTNASAVEESIYQVRNQSNQDPLNFPIKVNNRLATLLSMVERGDGRPTNNVPEVFEILSSELQGYLDRLAQVWSTDLNAVNAELRRLNLPLLDPRCSKTEGCT